MNEMFPKVQIFVLCLLATAALAQDPPEIQRLKTALAPGSTERLFGDVMYVGPFLWDAWRTGPLGQLEGPTANFQPTGVEGKVLRDGKPVEDELRKLLAGGFTVRALTAEEAALYKSMVPYPVEGEPVWIAETADHKLLFHFNKGYAFALDDYQDASPRRLDEIEARQPPWPLITDYQGKFSAYRDGQPVTDRGPFAVLLLTPEAQVEQRVAVVQLGTYVQKLRAAVALDEVPRDLIVQVELAPSRPVTLTLQARPETDTAALRARLEAVETPYVRGRVVFQLLVRLNGGTGAPLGP